MTMMRGNSVFRRSMPHCSSSETAEQFLKILGEREILRRASRCGMEVREKETRDDSRKERR
jgi:hypothetical protein